MNKRSLLIGVICVFFISSILVLSAYSEDQKTQGEFAQQLCKALGLDITKGDHIKQLESRSVIPEGGWQETKPISIFFNVKAVILAAS